MPDRSAIEAGARALREQWPHIFVLAGERADQMAQAVLTAAYPSVTQQSESSGSLSADRWNGMDWLADDSPWGKTVVVPKSRLIAAEQRAEKAEGNLKGTEAQWTAMGRKLEDAEADRDRLQRELNRLTGGPAASARVKEFLAEHDDLYDALQGLYNAVDRWGWSTGTYRIHTRDVILAKARDALGEGPGRRQSY